MAIPPAGGLYPGQALASLAPAKLNLSLRLIGRRPDGYHLLESLFAFSAYGDWVRLLPGHRLDTAYGPSPYGAVRVLITGRFANALKPKGSSPPHAPNWHAPEDNLVVRAAHLALSALGKKADFSLQLIKRLPVAAGLGGGSADAAATLRLIARYYKLTPPAYLALCETVGPVLGADVPACLAAQPVWAEGIGDILRPIANLPSWPLLMVNPAWPLPTPKVFAAERARRSSLPQHLASLWSLPAPFPAHSTKEAWHRWLVEQGNDLTAAASQLCPLLPDLLACLARMPGARLVRLSGSGASCFALFNSKTAAQAAKAEIYRIYPQYWCVATMLRASPKVN
jgi:4-diphosphocytidyl-2-C-methyl-D-erythritol kinase